jgi:putative ABC transport system ATP-binding protein
MHELPRGMRQQIAVISGVASGSRLVLADEPTAQLTKEAGTGVIDLFRRINERFGTTVVMVTHDPGVAAELPRTLTIRDGRVGTIAQRGEEFAVIDRTGSIQLPPDILEILPPNSRVRIVRRTDGVEFHTVEDES